MQTTELLAERDTLRKQIKLLKKEQKGEIEPLQKRLYYLSRQLSMIKFRNKGKAL